METTINGLSYGAQCSNMLQPPQVFGSPSGKDHMEAVNQLKVSYLSRGASNLDAVKHAYTYLYA
jgi:hypothetical protein